MVSNEDGMIAEILYELQRARTKFPIKRSQPTIVALMEEVGELAKASMDEPRERVYKEAIQVCVMAMRVWLDGDYTIEARREENFLPPLRVISE